ncbi:hypothetical protein YN1_4990 [Nanoarchaeota archaeon]
MNFTGYVKDTYNLYKKNIVLGFAYGILKNILVLVNAIPIIGVYIYSYYYPRLLVWYYQKLSGEKLNPNYKVSFISIFIPQILQNILLFVSFLVIIYFYLSSYFLTFKYSFSSLLSGLSISYSIMLGISFLIYLFSLYSFYGSLYGKVDKYNFEVNNSSILFFNILSLSLVFGIIEILVSLIVLINTLLLIVPILIWILFFTSILDLLPMIVIKDM